MLEKYPDVFETKFIDFGLFCNTYAQVCTRNFGYGLPSPCMIPMADNQNHADYSMSHEVINIELHLYPNTNPHYGTPSKMINNFETLFSHLKFKITDDMVV